MNLKKICPRTKNLSLFDWGQNLLCNKIYLSSPDIPFVSKIKMFKLIKTPFMILVPAAHISTGSSLYLSKIYTKTGDKGTSSTYTGERKYKDDNIFEALGTTDELTSAIGFAREFLPESCNHINTQLQEVQCIIQDLAASVATPKSSRKSYHEVKTKFPAEHVDVLENWIDEHTKTLPPLTSFILPSGGTGSSALHMARSICRRAERRIVPLVRDDEVDEAPMRYLNRLSDYLFTVARVTGLAAGRKEFVYWESKPKVKKGN